MSEDEGPAPQPDRAEQSREPGVLDASTAGKGKLVTLRLMSPMEAELARAKLGAEGIPAFVVDENLAIMYPWVFPDAKLQVHPADVNLAQEILSRPAPMADDGDYADENWRCPNCHRKNVELLPLPGRWKFGRNFLFIVFPLPLVLGLFDMGIGRNISRVIEPYSSALLMIWMIVVATLAISLALLRRRKRCTNCGLEWDSKRKDPDNEPSRD